MTLRTNLSTRPFYNERAVRVLLGGLLLLVLAVTVAHVVRAVSLQNEERDLSARATAATGEAERLRAEAKTMTAQIDQKELAVIAAAAAEVNGVIERRTFSWGAFLSDLEATLPGDVRVLSLEPQAGPDGMHVVLNVEARTTRDLAAFMDALEARGTFRSVVPRGQTYSDDVIAAMIQATYQRPPERGPAVTPASARSAR